MAVGAFALLAAALTASSTTRGPTADAGASLGVFRGATGTDEFHDFEAWLGRDLDVALTFLDYDRWESIEAPDWFVQPWSQWILKGPDHRLVLSVAMLPGEWATDEVVAAELRAGARGEFDEHFRVLARRLVDNGLGNSVLRIGWEANGDWYRWRASPDPEAWVDYFRRIVDVMRATPGSNFQIDWSVSIPSEWRSSTGFYPGDDVVDVIGVDVYDKSWQDGTWEGLTFWRRFANEHGKLLAIPEWGVVDTVVDGVQRGGLDNPAFIDRMADWIEANDVAYHVYFEYDSGGNGGDHRLTNADSAFPRSATRFRDRFGSEQPEQRTAGED
jgi:hypothetical protein